MNFIFKIFLIYFLFFNSTFAELINKIEIEGNKRITKETIKAFANIQLNNDYSSDDVNNIIKILYDTNFFSNIEISIDKKTMFIAGIYDQNQFCLITEQANENLKKIHHRQPVILNEKEVNEYLDLQLNGSAFLKEKSKININFYEVSKDVNKPTTNNVSLIHKLS